MIGASLRAMLGTAGYEYWLNNSNMLGRNTPITCSRTGGRISVLTGEELAENELDYVEHNDICVVAAMEGRTNLVSTDILNDWSTVATGGTVDVTEPQSGIYRVAVTQSAGQTNARVYYRYSSTSGTEETFGFEIRKVSGDCSDLNVFVQKATAPWTVPVITDLSSITTEWTKISGTTSGIDWTDNSYLMFDSDNKTCVFEVRNIRHHASEVLGAPHPYQSAAGHTYGTDILSASGLTIANAGSAMIGTSAYGWTGGENPANSSARLLLAGPADFDVSVGLSPYYVTEGVSGASSASAIGTGWEVTFAAWDGVNHYIQKDAGARISAVAADKPDTTWYLGNYSNGIRPFHGAGAFLIRSGVASDAEYAIIRAGLLARLANLEFAV